MSHSPRHAGPVAADAAHDEHDEHTARHATPLPFVDRVNRRLSDYIGFRTVWQDLVGDWPEADMRETDDVEGAVEWILANAGH
jgi:hypothetical protein